MRYWTSIFSLALAQVCWAVEPQTLEAIEQLAARGDHVAALQSADAALAALPPEDSSVAWTLDFRNAGIQDAIVGRRFIYFFDQLHLEHGEPRDPWPNL